MAPRPPASQAALPATFRCRVCGQNKVPGAFSNSQIQKWRNKKKNDRRNEITPETVGLICTGHDGERDLRCHGPCDRSKPVQLFSKTQRNAPTPWCIECTEWRNHFEGLEIPTAGPRATVTRGLYTSKYDDSDEAEDSGGEETAGLPNDPTPVTSVVGSLHGYDAAGPGTSQYASTEAGQNEGAMTNAVSTVGSAEISLWNGENDDASRSDAGSGNSNRTIIGIQSNSMRSGQTLVNTGDYQASAISNPRQGDSHTPTDYTPSRVPRYIGRLVPLRHAPDQNPDIQADTSATSGLPVGLGELAQPTEQVRRMAVAVGNEPTKTSKDASKENKNHRWYHGATRRVFRKPGENSAALAEARAEFAHDSDSGDDV
ncbi:hypothetical protein F4861DRAFT_161701 [Xylaria intraflava]|nr:hypothetical protein F4861DRAFT_161701 [Xylaria intraflava]